MTLLVCEKCGGRLTGREQHRFCSIRCAAMRPRSEAPRSKPCAACGKVFTRRYPYQVRRTSHCSKRCEGITKRKEIMERRLPTLEAKYGDLSLRERELFAHGYRLGYQRRRQTELRRMERAA
jgi:endogenous inhibitor of DNA gyrase (YacG/DUF329 family)